eukprot:gene19556-26238_t
MTVNGRTVFSGLNCLDCERVTTNDWVLNPNGPKINLTNSSVQMKALVMKNSNTVVKANQTLRVSDISKTGNTNVGARLFVDGILVASGNGSNSNATVKTDLINSPNGSVFVNNLNAREVTANAMTISRGKDMNIDKSFRVGANLGISSSLISAGNANISGNATIANQLTMKSMIIKDTSRGFACNSFDTPSPTTFSCALRIGSGATVKGLSSLHSGDIELHGVSSIKLSGFLQIFGNGKLSGSPNVFYSNGDFVNQDIGYTKPMVDLYLTVYPQVATSGSYNDLVNKLQVYTKTEIRTKIKEKITSLRKVNNALTALSQFASSPRVFVYDLPLKIKPNQSLLGAVAQPYAPENITVKHVSGITNIAASPNGMWEFGNETATVFRKCEIDNMSPNTVITVGSKLYTTAGKNTYVLVVVNFVWTDNTTISHTVQYETTPRFLPSFLDDENIRSANLRYIAGGYLVAAFLPTDARPPAVSTDTEEWTWTMTTYQDDNYEGKSYDFTSSMAFNSNGVFKQNENEYFINGGENFGPSSYKFSSNFQCIVVWRDKGRVVHVGAGAAVLGDISVNEYRINRVTPHVRIAVMGT